VKKGTTNKQEVAGIWTRL